LIRSRHHLTHRQHSQRGTTHNVFYSARQCEVRLRTEWLCTPRLSSATTSSRAPVPTAISAAAATAAATAAKVIPTLNPGRHPTPKPATNTASADPTPIPLLHSVCYEYPSSRALEAEWNSRCVRRAADCSRRFEQSIRRLWYQHPTTTTSPSGNDYPYAWSAWHAAKPVYEC
jgi:hypothetical protein